MEICSQVRQNLRSGDRSAFKLVFDTYSPGIFELSYKILKSRELAEEIVQDTFIKLWLSRENIDISRNLWSLIYVIAKRLCFNKLRSAKYDILLQQELVHHMSLAVEDSTTQVNELEQLLKHSVGLLPARQREVWQLSREEGLSHKEIADHLGISPNTVKNSLVQTLKYLRQHFKKADYLYFFIFLYFL
ncbi:RNA polymerase sigma factor [Desertivirga xinjiangensis]|uniref:RNA polymerase sigma factor n=1 Tax=Desertivirga xinjiangensis TaxID=539206 RepID=UPI00210B3FB7|nr:RNA polymerase sigma-70 factor [Pedobacter xinjiangensis]